MKVLGIIFLVIIILVIGGCGVSMFAVGKAVDDSSNSASSFNEVADQVTLGMTRAEVKALAGEPESKTVSEAEYGDVKTNTEIWIYGVLDVDGCSLSFENDVLRLKMC